MSAAAVNTEAAYPSLDEARTLAAELLQSAGAPAAAAQAVARSLVLAEQLGHASHGLIRVPEYLDAVASGQVRPAETPVVASRAGSTAVVDGRWGWGHLAAELGARTATGIARDTGVGLVAVRNCNHSGRLGEWVEYIAGNGLVGAGFLSCGPAVAPLGGVERVLGTNPLAVAIPTGDEERPVVLDFATAGVAEGKIRVAAQAGRPAPAGVLQTADGQATTDPREFYAGGSILPFGAHKGYGLSVVIQLLGEALAGGARPDDPRSTAANGLVLLAFSPGGLREPADFTARVDECRDRILASRPADPGAPVLMPGDVEARHAAAQPPGQLRVSARLWADLRSRGKGGS